MHEYKYRIKYALAIKGKNHFVFYQSRIFKMYGWITDVRMYFQCNYKNLLLKLKQFYP